MILLKCNLKTNKQGREINDHGSALFPIACYDEDLSSDPVPWHWHDELEAIVITEGCAIIFAGSEQFTVKQCGDPPRCVYAETSWVPSSFHCISPPFGRGKYRQYLLAELHSAFAAKRSAEMQPF